MKAASAAGRVNVKVLLIVVLVVAGLVAAALAVRAVRRRVLSARALVAGTAAYERNEWDVAAGRLREYLSRNPDDVDVLRKYAYACMRVRPFDPTNVAAAIGACRGLLQHAPGDREIHALLARHYRWIGDYSSLAYIARRRQAADADDPDAPIWLGRAQMGLQQTNQARQTLTAYVERCERRRLAVPQFAEACAMLAELAETTQADRAAAVAWMDRAIRRLGRSGRALSFRAAHLRRAGDRSRAEADLAAAESLQITDPQTRLLLCDEWTALGQYTRAAAHLQWLDRLDADEVADHFMHHDEWLVACLQRAARLAVVTDEIPAAADRAERVLAVLVDRQLRTRALPASVRVFAAAGRAAAAREALSEYIRLLQARPDGAVDTEEVVALRAAVLGAEDRPYDTVALLEPRVAADRGGPDSWRLLAQAYSRSGQRRRAAAALRRYLQLRPDDPAMQLQLAREYVALGWWTKADQAAQAHTLDPTDPVVAVLRMECRLRVLLAAGEPAAEPLSRLRSRLAQLMDRHPDRADLPILAARIAEARGDRAEAERILRKLARADRPSADAHGRLVRLLAAADRFDEAIAEARALCERHPSQASSWLVLADVLVADGRVDEALAALASADRHVEAGSRRILVVRWARIQIADGDRSAGAQRLSRLAAEEPKAVDVRTMLLAIPEVRSDPSSVQRLIDEIRAVEGAGGLMWRRHQAELYLAADTWRNRRDEIAALLTRCVEADGDWVRPVILLGAMHEMLDEPRQAEQTYRRHIETAGPSPAVVTRLRMLLHRRGRFAEAVRLADGPGRGDPDEARILQEKILWWASQQQMGRIVAAMAEPTVGASDPDVQNVAATFLGRSAEPDHRAEAIRLFQQVCRAQPDRVESRHRLAGLLYQAGETAKAVEHLRRAMADDGANVDVLNDLAWMLQQSAGLYEEALALADKGLAIDGRPPAGYSRDHSVPPGSARRGPDGPAAGSAPPPPSGRHPCRGVVASGPGARGHRRRRTGCDVPGRGGSDRPAARCVQRRPAESDGPTGRPAGRSDRVAGGGRRRYRRK